MGVDPVCLGKTLERHQELTRAAAQVEEIYEMTREAPPGAAMRRA